MLVRFIQFLLTLRRGAPSPGALLWAALGCAAVTVSANGATASETYPDTLDRHTGVSCPRPLTRCLICHDTAAGGEETANRPFALALVNEYGLSGGKSPRELAMALQALPADVDTDEDGTPDQEEIASCMNPSGEELSEGPGYGCNVGPRAPAVGGLGWCAALLAIGAALVARRREVPGPQQQGAAVPFWTEWIGEFLRIRDMAATQRALSTGESVVGALSPHSLGGNALDSKGLDRKGSEATPSPAGRFGVDAIPSGYHSVTPYLTLSDCAKAARFYARAFGAVELYRLRTRDGRIAHSELQIGNSRIMICDEAPESGSKSARSYGGTPMVLRVYTCDVDALAARFVGAGGTIMRPLCNQFYGDRSGQFVDPEGYRWILSQRLEEVAPEEMVRRSAGLWLV